MMVCTRFWVLSSILMPILLKYDVWDVTYMPKGKAAQTDQGTLLWPPGLLFTHLPRETV
jgi:vacuolar-type H+-ATPase subunit C/Vma6